MIDQLVRILAQGSDLSAEEILDVLWLAATVTGPDTQADELESASEPDSADDAGDAVPAGGADEADRTSGPDAEIPLHLGGDAGGAGHEDVSAPVPATEVAFGVPRPIRDPLTLPMALRRLRRIRTPGPIVTVDIDATVEATADAGGRLMTVLTRPPQRSLDLALVVDGAPSMDIWAATFDELERLLAQTGAFRSVSRWTLRLSGDGAQLQSRDNRAHPPRRLIDPSGRRLVLLATDGRDEAWYSAAPWNMLDAWCAVMPTALLQMLPQHYWATTAVGDPYLAATALRPTAPNSQYVHRLAWWADDPGGLPLPVVTLSPQALETWAHVVAGGNAWATGITAVPPAPESAPPPNDSGADPLMLVNDFRSRASRGAQRLARILASTEALSMPLIEVLQDRLAPETGVLERAEVLASGMLAQNRTAGGRVLFHYLPGIPEILRRGATTFEEWDTYAAVSQYLEDRHRLGGPLHALIADPPGTAELDATEAPFAALHESLAVRLGLRDSAANRTASPTTYEPSEVEDPAPGETEHVLRDEAGLGFTTLQPAAAPDHSAGTLPSSTAQRNVRAVDTARSRIVLFGTPSYVDPGLPDVPVVANNVADLAAVFTDPDLGGFSPAHCVTVPADAGVAEVGDLLIQAATEAEDLLLFYYSGHAKPWHRDREYYLCLAGTRPDRLPFSALRFEAVRDAVRRSKARNRVIILDSCYSGRAMDGAGTLGDDEVLQQLEVTGACTLTSASATKPAEFRVGEPHTAFTERLLHLLRTGLPEAGAWLSLADIHRALNRQLNADGLPSPEYLATKTAESLGLTRNPCYNPAAAAAAAVREAVASRTALPQESVLAGSPADRLRQRAAAALNAAERDALTIPGEPRKALALAGVAQALAAIDPDRAERTAQGITDGHQKVHALAGIARTLAATDPDRAERIAQSITVEYQKAQALADIAQVLAPTDPERASRLWGEAEDTARTIAHEQQKALALVGIVLALAPADPDRAERTARSITVYQKAQALAGVAQALAATDPDRAEDTARSITDATQKAQALAGIAQALAPTDPGRTSRLWGEAEVTARTIAHGQQKALTLARIVLALAPADPDRAERTAQGITDASMKAQALAGIAQALAATDPDRAERTAQSITHGHQKALALAGVARALAPSDAERAILLAAEAERIAGSIPNALSKAQALAGVAQALADTSPDRAEDIARSITDESLRAQALTGIARVWLGAA